MPEADHPLKGPVNEKIVLPSQETLPLAESTVAPARTIIIPRYHISYFFFLGYDPVILNRTGHPSGSRLNRPGCCGAERQKGSRSIATAISLVTPGLIFRPQKIICSLTCPKYFSQYPWLYVQTRWFMPEADQKVIILPCWIISKPSGMGWWINQKQWLSANSLPELTTPAIL